MANVPPPEIAKSYLVYDEYVLNQGDGNRVVSVDGSVTWQQFKIQNEIIKTLSWHTVSSDGVPCLPGETGPRQYPLATDISRKASKSLVKKVKRVHSDGCVLESLVEGNVRVYSSGKVKLQGVRRLTRQDLSAKEFKKLKKRNYQAAALLIRRLFTFPGPDSRIPSDICQLLDLLNHHMIKDREMFLIHSSLAPLVSFSPVSKEFKDYLDAKVNDGFYHAVCYAIIADFDGKDWREEVHSNDLLSETYGIKQPNPYYEVPRNTPGQTQRTRAQQDALDEVNLAGADPAGLTPFEEMVIDGHKLLKFLRNRFAHRSENLEAGYDTWNTMEHNFSARSSEVVARVKFGRVPGVIQLYLHRIGRLRSLKIDGLF